MIVKVGDFNLCQIGIIPEYDDVSAQDISSDADWLKRIETQDTRFTIRSISFSKDLCAITYSRFANVQTADMLRIANQKSSSAMAPLRVLNIG